MSIKSAVFTVVATCFLIHTSIASAVILTKNSVALYINYHIINNFYTLYTEEKEQPYLNVKSIMNNLLELPLVCKGYRCSAYSAELNKTFWIDFKEKTYGVKQKVNKIPMSAIKNINGQYWVKYSTLSHWLPINVHWDLDTYELHVIPRYRLISELNYEFQLQIDEKNRQNHKNDLKKQLKEIKTRRKFNFQGLYALNVSKVFHPNSLLNVNYYTTTDLFRGTLQTSGTISKNRTGPYSDSLAWDYSISRPGHFYRMVFGDTSYPGTWLIPSMNIKKAMSYERLHNPIVSIGYSLMTINNKNQHP